jgi:hypothetical protein
MFRRMLNQTQDFIVFRRTERIDDRCLDGIQKARSLACKPTPPHFGKYVRHVCFLVQFPIASFLGIDDADNLEGLKSVSALDEGTVLRRTVLSLPFRIGFPT